MQAGLQTRRGLAAGNLIVHTARCGIMAMIITTATISILAEIGA